MATTDENDLPPEGVRFATVRDMAGNVWEEAVLIEEAVSTTVHGRAGRPLWPVVLVLGVITAIMLGYTAAAVVGASLLLVWLVGR